MPRTKILKNSKRSREEALFEEKMRSFNSCLESALLSLESKKMDFIASIQQKISNIISSTNVAILDMPFEDILKFNLSSFKDCQNKISTELQSTKVFGRDDGYSTEESVNSVASSALSACLSISQHGRAPGPFGSAQAKMRRQRRSRSACLENTKSLGSDKSHSRNVPSSEHASRNKLRTPMSARPKAFSADRSAVKMKNNNGQKSPGCAFLRWPKPGEFVVSVHGSPLISQVMPDRHANVNIPIKDGVLSLRPKKLEAMDPNIVEKLEDQTLEQIKTLQQNLAMILSLANKNLSNDKN